jgi:hypothetical protein
MWTWLCQKALGRNVILVRFEARERPRAVDAPRHLPFIDKFLDLLHRLPRAGWLAAMLQDYRARTLF